RGRCRERPPRGGPGSADRGAAHARGGSGDDGRAALGARGAVAGGVAGQLTAHGSPLSVVRSTGRSADGRARVSSVRRSPRRADPPIPLTAERDRGIRRALTACSAYGTRLSAAARAHGAAPPPHQPRRARPPTRPPAPP